MSYTNIDIIALIVMDIIWLIGSVVCAISALKKRSKDEFTNCLICIFISPIGFIPLGFISAFGVLMFVFDIIPNLIYKALVNFIVKK